ncbi:hypothetical protein [Actinomadura miaoliensis]|uniref:Secreted protein n=1 Tax=Actinomadura miaoliensis TaxID=430685 RepID=A0ABP7WZN3_9ACTN
MHPSGPRRAATITVCTGLLLSGLGSAAAGAQAAANGSWTTRGGYAAVDAGGTYTRNAGRVTVNGWLRDRKTNGRAAAVQFRTTEGDWRHTSAVYFFLTGDRPADLPYRQRYGRFFSSDFTDHLYARECGVTPDRKRAAKCGNWQKIF